MIRAALLAFAATMLVAADDVTPPPAALVPYIHDGRFDPGDFGWLRGGMSEANPAQQADWASITAYQRTCGERGRASVRARLSAMGIAHPVGTARGGVDPVCVALSYSVPAPAALDSVAALNAAVSEARPVATAVIWSASLAQAVADPEEPGLASELRARPTTDQLLRIATAWNAGDHPGAPDLSPGGQAIARAMLWSTINARDAANTRWLRAFVDRQGWPRISAVGKEAAHDAWLLAQHADDEPDFQLRVLRLMEPLVATHEISEKDFAFLYDRVTIQLTGRQRYGTQLTCESGRWAPFPTEDPGKVAALRRSAGMDTLAENAARLEREAGPCAAR